MFETTAVYENLLKMNSKDLWIKIYFILRTLSDHIQLLEQLEHLLLHQFTKSSGPILILGNFTTLTDLKPLTRFRDVMRMMLILNLCLSQHTDTCRPHPLILFDTLCLGHLFNSLLSWMCQLLNLCSHTGLFWGHLTTNVKIRTTISYHGCSSCETVIWSWSEHSNIL